MRAAPTALCIIACLYASPVMAQKAYDFTVDSATQPFRSASMQRDGLAYPELSAPLQFGHFEVRQSLSTQMRFSPEKQQLREDRLLATEVRAPATDHARLQFNAKVLVPIKASDPLSQPLFVDKPSGNPYEVTSRKSKYRFSVGFTYRFGPQH